MSTSQPDAVHEIRKYPNRRLYDSTRSCHVTLSEVYDLVATGRSVRIVDSKTGEDLTNQVLLQAIVERDPLKLTAIPSPLLHVMIRMNHHLISSWFELFLRQSMEAYRTAGRPTPPPWWPAAGMWTGVSPTPGPPTPGAAGGWPWAGAGGLASPFSWMEQFLAASGVPAGSPPPPDATEDEDDAGDDPTTAPDEASGDRAADLERLREQLAALAEEVARLRARDRGDEA